MLQEGSLSTLSILSYHICSSYRTTTYPVSVLRLLSHVEEQKLGGLVAHTRNLDRARPSRASDERTITLPELHIADPDSGTTTGWLLLVAHHDMEIDLSQPIADKLMGHTFAWAKDTRTHADIGMHRYRFRLPILTRMAVHRLHEPAQPICLHLVREFARLV